MLRCSGSLAPRNDVVIIMSTLKLPGLIDIHVHLRDPGQTHKEDFRTGTTAALAGGFTKVFDMPNNTVPITTHKLLNEKIKIAKASAVCDIGFYFGSLGDNLGEFVNVQHQVAGLKLYLNMTTGGFIIDEKFLWSIYKAWNSSKPILLHSEEDMIQQVLKVVRKTGQHSHFCHVSSANELQQIISAKEEGLPVSCGVTAHHLFLTEDEGKKLGAYGHMKPYLKPKNDVDYLWKNIKHIDVVESDHAPHTKEEKESEKPPFGVPGLETTLPLLLTAVHEKRLSLEEVIRLCYDGPRKIHGIPDDETTFIEVEIGKKYEIKNENLHTKCKWSPFNGWKVYGKVQRVFIRNKKVFENDKVVTS